MASPCEQGKEKQEAGSTIAKMMKHMPARWKACGSLIKQRPHIAIVPAFVFLLLIGCGILAIQLAQKDTIQHAKALARELADGFSKDVKIAFSQMALPMQQVTALVRQVPDFQPFMQMMNLSSDAIWEAAPNGASAMAVAPHGHCTTFLPKEDPFGKFLVGVDFYMDYGLLLRQLRHTTVDKTGPIVVITQPVKPFFVVLVLPVWLNAPANETFGIPWNASFCTPELCYNATTGQSLWGSLSISFSLPVLPSLKNALEDLQSRGHHAQIYRPAESSYNETGWQPMLSNLTSPDDAEATTIALGDQEWQVRLWPADGYSTPWYNWMYFVVVFGSLTIAALLLQVLLSREEHKSLLQSLLPREMLNRMRAETDWSHLDYDGDTATKVSLETPAGNILAIIAANLQNEVPNVQLLLSVKTALMRSADVYKPTLETLEERMKESAFVDAEVRQALVAQLVGNTPAANASEQDDIHATDGTVSAEQSTSHAVLESEHGDGSMQVMKSKNSYKPAGTGDQGSGPNAIKEHQDPASNSKPLASKKSLNSEGSSHNNGLLHSELIPAVGAYWDSHSVQDMLLTLMHVPAGLADQPNLLHISAAAHLPTVPELGTRDMDELHHEVFLHAEDPQPAIPVPSLLLTKLDKVLGKANEWIFDIYELDEASQGRPLSVLGYWLLNSTGLKAYARMDGMKLARFLQLVEDGYPNNPYHNNRHAASVLHATHTIMTRGGFRPAYADNLTTLATYMAAIVHDLGHRGRTNDFLVNSHDMLAVRYNDRSPMENHHLAAAFELLKQPDSACISPAQLGKAKWQQLRKLIIDLVLATDMKAHFATVGQFEAQVPVHESHNRSALCSSTGRPSLDRPSSALFKQFSRRPTADQDLHSTSRSHVHAISIPVPASDAERLLGLQMVLKCADLGHLTLPLRNHTRWVGVLEEEFFQQGDEERAAGLTISPLCDRHKEGVTKSQVGFFDFVVIPMFKAFCARFPSTDPLWHGLMANYKHWSAAAKQNSRGPSTRSSVASRPSLQSNK